MRIGLLECDHVAERYLPIAGDYSDMFTTMVAAVDPTAEVVQYDVRNGVLPGGPGDCDAWLCTGSSASVYDEEPWIEAAAGFVRDVQDAGVPFVGVCFGHQLLAHALGGRTERAATGWGVGALAMDVIDGATWMRPQLPTATLLYSHQDQVTALPPGSRVLAAAPHCPVAMLAVGDDMIGMQAHPEFGVPYVRALLEDRVDRIGEAGATAALDTLDRATDEAAVARWLLAFMRSRVPQGEEPRLPGTLSSADGEVGDRDEEMLERGAAQEGEGKPGA
jgi:GMP synthase-like glutamine amidotransferase